MHVKRFVVISLCSCFLSGCLAKGVVTPTPHELPSFFPEDIVTKRAETIENMERFQAFYSNIQAAQKDQVRIIQYTTEGEPIYTDVVYEGQTFHVKIDDSQDTYSDKKVINTTCKELNAIEVESRTDYFVNQCENNERYVIFSDY